MPGFLLVLSVKEEDCGRKNQVVLEAGHGKSAIVVHKTALLYVCLYKTNGFEEAGRLSYQERLGVHHHLPSQESSDLHIPTNQVTFILQWQASIPSA